MIRHRDLAFTPETAAMLEAWCRSAVNATPFHHPDWLRSVGANDPRCYPVLRVLEVDGRTAAVMPCFRHRFLPGILVSSVSGGYGGFLFREEDRSTVRAALERSRPFPPLACVHCFGPDVYAGLPGFVRRENHTYIKELPDSSERLFAGFSSKLRNQIRRSEGPGLAYAPAPDRGQLSECLALYDLLARRRRIGRAVKPETFDRLARAARRGGPIAFPVALHEGRVAAFSIFLRGPGHVFYWMNASDPALSRLNATTGLLWRAMREACGRRATLFNLGACPDGEEGLARFKESWGSVKTAYPSYHTRWYGILR